MNLQLNESARDIARRSRPNGTLAAVQFAAISQTAKNISDDQAAVVISTQRLRTTPKTSELIATHSE